MTGATHPDRLERRYRRLLASYPAAHRAEYDDEMIGVLMSATAPDQTRPGVREAVNLIASGLRARLRTILRGASSTAWRDAAGVFGFLTPVLIAAMSGYQAVADLTGRGPFYGPARTAIAMTIGWSLVAIATGLGRPRIAAFGATAGVLGQTVGLALRYADRPDALVTSWWRLMLAASAAGALLSLLRSPHPAPDGDHPRPLGRRATIAVTVAAMLLCVAPLVESWTVTVSQFGAGSWQEQSWMPFSALGMPVVGDRPVGLIAGVLLLGTLAVVVRRLAPSLRRRVLLLGTPAAATALLVAGTFGGFLVSSPRFSPPVHLIATQWIGLVGTPLLAFALGAWLLGRYEQRLASGALLA
jgi:hypothetical protein